MALKIKNKVSNPKQKWKDSKCKHCALMLYSDIDSIISGTPAPDDGYCGAEKAKLHGQLVNLEDNACVNFESYKDLIQKVHKDDTYKNVVKKNIRNECKNCSFFVLPKNKVDSQGFKVDYGFCSKENSDYYKKSILMVQKSCTLFQI